MTRTSIRDARLVSIDVSRALYLAGRLRMNFRTATFSSNLTRGYRDLSIQKKKRVTHARKLVTSWASDSMDLEAICLAITSTLREAERNLLDIRGRKGMFRAVQKVTDTESDSDL